MNSNTLLKMVLSALFTGLMIAGALIAIPFPDVPMVIANAFPWLAGLLLGPVWAGISVGLYLLLGAFGLPVFAKGGAGIGILLGNTGGFLVGYLLAAIVVGLLRDPEGKSVARTALSVFAGLVAIYLVGIPWLAVVVFKGAAGFQGTHLLQAALWGTGSKALPGLFLIGDAIKAVAVVAAASVLNRLPGIASLYRKA